MSLSPGRCESPTRGSAYARRQRPTIATWRATSATGSGRTELGALLAGLLSHFVMLRRERPLLLRRRLEARRDTIAVFGLTGLPWLSARLPIGLRQILVHLGHLLDTQGFRFIRLGDGLVIRRGLGGLDLRRIERRRRASCSPYAT